ncbi:uncharacterized protein LOC135836183 [Planococcus citri]|uniref:uncharacterized protein LOC135836183 n=1 Tax=Planococcus citri TaxID=170843 RepID=UPI0031F8C2DD
MASPSTSVMASPSTSTMSESNNVGGPETITTISPQRFIELAMEIVSLFPTEKVGTYYTAYRRVNGRPCNAHGKLLDRHQYIRKCLKADGILCEPTTDEESNDLGRNINIDFEKLYPSKIEEFRSRWNGNLRAAFIKVILQNKKLLLSLTPEFLEAWTGINNLPEDQQDAIILQTIPFLVKPITSGKRKRNETAFRPSATEIADDFIIRVETPNEVKTAVEKKKKEYLDQKRTVQPFMIFVGSYTQIESFYALINDHYYTFTSALDAVIFTFSSFYVLDLEYPAAAKNVWLLLQIAAYNITHKVDKIGTQLSVLITDLQ